MKFKKALSVFFIMFVFAGTAYAETPADAKLQYNTGVDFYKVGKYDNAMEAFRRAIDLDPNYIDAYYNLGSILEFLGQYDAALTVFKQIIVRKPDDYDAVYKAAALSIKLGQPEKAKMYLSLIPNDTTIYRKAQELSSQIGGSVPTVPAASETSPQTHFQSMENPPAQPQSNQYYDNIISPTGIATDKEGNIYVAGFSDNSIIKITPAGERIIFLKDTRVNGPISLATDSRENLYISNYNSDNVLKVGSDGAVSVLIPNIQKPYGLHVDGDFLYVSSQGANAVLKYKLY